MQNLSLPPSAISIGYLCDRCIGSIFSYVSITDFTKLFWPGDAYFGNQDSTYISYVHFSIPRFPCLDLVSLAWS